MRSLRRFIRNHIWSLSTLLILIGVGIFVGGFLVVWASTLRIPDLNSFEERIVQQSTKIYDRTGEILLFDVHEDVQRTVIPYDEISHHIKNATIAIEDAEFYDHNGIRPLATLRALFLQPLRGKGVQGGSTITQQVVKNSVLTSERKISRKLKEWVLAIKIEQVLSKEDILELYLNESPYGGNMYGVEEASQAFFDKSAADVTLVEAAYLAALPQAPTFYSPYGNNRDDLDQRQNLVLNRMLQERFITQEEYDEAVAETISFQPRPDVRIKAPHFVFHVIEQLEERYGQRALEEQGFRVITTLDYELQERAEEIVKQYALENEKKFNAENGALVALDPRTGGILTMVGSRDYFDESIEGNFNVALAHRQPGSAFKPFVYATALKKGYTTETVVFDLKTQFSTECPAGDLSSVSPCYSPGNYDNVFRGPMTFREALAQSVNIPAVKVLYLAGLNDSLRTARDLGIKSLTNIAQYGLTLVLGGGEVSPLDMAGAYGVFANDGVRNDPVSILRIEDGSGNIVEEFNESPQKTLDSEIARSINDILTDNEARTPAFGANSYLYFGGRDVAAKTGTTNDYRDAWIVGYTPSISVAAWAGNNDNSSMEKRVAGFIVAPMWNEFMRFALDRLPEESFPDPQPLNIRELKPVLRGTWEGGETYFIDTISKKLATEYTPNETLGEIVVPDVHSILHWVDRSNPRGAIPRNPENDSQYLRWESPVRSWAAQQNLNKSPQIPDAEDDVHTKDTQPDLDIIGIASGDVIDREEVVRVSVENDSKYNLSEVLFFINGRLLETDTSSSFVFTFIPEEVDLSRGEATLRIVAKDRVFNTVEEIISFTID